MFENLSLIIFSGQAVVYSIVNNSHFLDIFPKCNAQVYLLKA